MKLVDKILYESKISLLEKKSTYTYGCVLLNLKFPQQKEIHSKIDKDDLYEEKDNDQYGLEKESHVTLLYGLHKEVTIDQIKEVLESCTFPTKVKLKNASLFENDQDVLKFDVDSKQLSPINKKLKELPYTSKYSDYKPHMTIAYLQSGKGKKYVSLFKDKEYELSVQNCVYSQPDGSKTTINIKKK